MVTVIETWFLKEEFADKALQLMQEMDDIVGPGAHGDAGWSGHAQFFQREAKPAEVIMMYPWRSIELHKSLRENEEPLLADFVSTYCARERTIEYATELEVEVEHDDHHHHH